MANRTNIENLQELIKDSIRGELVAQTVELLLPPGENFGSVMYKVDFKVKNDDKEEEYHAVAKCTPLNTVTQELFNIKETFKSEIAWYTTVIPTLKQFQRDQGVEKEIDFFQPFYGARISLDPTSDKVDLGGVILTQNLKYLGYHNVDRHIGFDLPTTYRILRDLATFHAVSLALITHDPDLFEKNIKPYMPKFAEFDEPMQIGFNKQLYNVYDRIPEFHPIMDRIRKYIDKAKVYGGRPVREPWVTVVHMDFWMNNIMVTGGKDSKTMILDLQFPALASPAADLMLLLLTSVKFDVIDENFDAFVEFYHEQFCKTLRELNVSTENYSFEGLLQEIQAEVREGAFSHSLVHTIMILGEKGKTTFDSSDANFKIEDFEKNGPSGVNEKQIEKFKWITNQAVKRQWI